LTSEVRLPRLGQGMEAGRIVRWLKAEGERVEKGEPLFEVDTDKATQEVEAEASGVLLRIAVHEGEVPVGETIGLIGEEGEAVAAATVSAPAGAGAGAAVAAPAGAPGGPVAARAGGGRRASGTGGRVKASPLARRLARERGVELAALRGTGPEGRIVAEDVERAPAPAPAAAPPAPADVPAEAEVVPLTKVRATIARRLTAAWTTPVFQLTASADMTRATALLARARELDPDVRVTVTDLLVRVCATALRRHRDVNVRFTDEALLRFSTADIGLAVAAPDGLVVPVIRAAERLSLAETARARAALVDRARAGRLAQRDLEGGTFTISNLGMYGVEQFTAVLNPPQAAILAVGATEARPVVRDGEVVVRPTMTVTLTVDHRAVDGAEAAQFLRTVKTFLEEPALAL